MIAISVTALSACSTVLPSSPVLTIPNSLKARCERPVAAFETVGGLGAYAVRMKGAADCGEARADSIAALVDSFNAIVHPPKRKWWPFKLPDG